MRIKTLLVGFILIGSMIIVFNNAGDEAKAQTTFYKYASNPVLTVGAFGEWDDEHAVAGAVIKDGGTYKMWYTGFDSWNYRIGYATSPDGKTWTKYGANPVIDVGTAGSWDDQHVYCPTVIKEGATYKMWYGGMDAGYIFRIFYATSPDGTTWTKYGGGTPVLNLGASGTWDDYNVVYPTVIYDGLTYEMWYTGFADATVAAIGYATSSDGIAWTKYASNPVLNVSAPGNWDYLAIASGSNSVIYDGTYRFWYSGRDDDAWRIGYAESSDGVNWVKNASNPILDVGAPGEWDEFWVMNPSVLFDGFYKMWYTGSILGYYNGQIGYADESDNVPPMITATIPANLAMGVALDQNVIITFSEPINTTTFAYTIMPNPGGWTWAWSGGNTTATGTHINFLTDTTYTFAVTAAKDKAGNPLAAGSVSNPWSWSTIDTISPEITATTPFHTESGVALNQNVVITFNEPIDTTTFNYDIVPNPGGWFWTWSGGNTIATGIHNNFFGSVLFTFTITGAEDLGGNPLTSGAVPNPWNWTTEPGPDLVPPEIMRTTPVDNALNIPLSQPVIIEFTEAIDTATFAFAIIPDPGGWIWTWNAGNTTVMGTHDNFTISTIYMFSVTAADDMAGNSLAPSLIPNPWDWTTTADPIPPEIIGTQPVHLETDVALDRNVEITFSEPIDTATFNYTISPDPGGWTWIWSGGNTIVTGLHNNFMASTSYTFTVTAANDTAGNQLASGSVSNPWIWATGVGPDTTPPEITATNPVNGATDVPLYQNVIITFSEEINTSTFAYAIVPDPSGWNWIWSGLNTIVTGSHPDFVASTTYNLTVTSAEDMAGNSLATGTIANPWNWTTGTPDLIPPEITATNPTNSAIGVALDQDVIITFSEPIDTVTFAYTISPDPGGWTWTWSGGDTVAAGTHINFTASTLHTFEITQADDLAGNSLASGSVSNPWSWTTGTGPDITSPEITATTPMNLAMDVALDQNVVITFSEAIDTATFNFTASPNPGGWTWTWSIGNTVATGSHMSFLESTLYSFTVTTANDTAGNSLTIGPMPNPWSWTTESIPQVMTGKIVGTVSDESGEPIVDANVTLTNSTSGEWTTTTNTTGGFSFEDMEPEIDIYSITAEKLNYKTSTKDGIDVIADGTTEVNIVLYANATISGKVVDEDGDPISNANVILLDDSGTAIDYTTTDSNGDFKFYELGYGSYKIYVNASEFDGNTTELFTINKTQLNKVLPNIELTSTAKPPIDGGSNWWWLVLIIVIIVIIVLVVLLLLFKKRKKPEEESKPEPSAQKDDKEEV